MVTLHAEEGNLVKYFNEKFEEEGRIRSNDWCIKNWSKAIPNFTAKIAVDSAIAMAKHVDVPLCIVHISTKEEVESISKAKREGQKVYAEAALHYLLISHEDNERLGPFSKIDPPIRSRQDIEGIWQGIATGTVDTLCTLYVVC